MAKYDQHGKKTQSFITSPVDEDFNYKFWVQRGTGKWPNFDEETEECHLEGLFVLEFDEYRLKDIGNRDALSGGNVYGSSYTSYYYKPEVEKDFLKRVLEKLKGANIEASLIARGSCYRRGRQAWQFKTVEYLVKTETNAVLLKLMGIEKMIEEVWEEMEASIQKFYDEWKELQERREAHADAVYEAECKRDNAAYDLRRAENLRSQAASMLKQAEELEKVAVPLKEEALAELLALGDFDD